MGFFSKLFNSFGPKGIVDAQIDVFKKLKNKYPYKPKDELLNLLIISRVNAPCGLSSKSLQMSHYADLVDNNQKNTRRRHLGYS